MYFGEPSIMPVCVSSSPEARMRAMPKSVIFTGPSAQHHDVGGLDVAVHHAVLVRVGEALGHLRGDRHRLRHAAAARPSASSVRSSTPSMNSIAM